MSLRPCLRVLFAMVVGALAACTAESDEPPAIAEVELVAPVPRGHGIARAPVTWVDGAPAEAGTASGRRELRGWIYYPAAEAAGAGGVALDRAWAEAYRPTLERRIGKAAADAMLQATWHADDGGAAAPGRFPVLVFAHGYRQLPTNYSALIEAMVARGYAVLAPASPGVADVVLLEGGRMAERQGLGDDMYDLQAFDVASAVAEVARLDVADGEPYAGHLDLSRIGVFGHSLGGAAAVLAAARVPAIRAAANLDGDYSGPAESARPRVPLLYVTTQPPNREVAPLDGWDDESNERRRARIWQGIAAGSPRALRVRIGGMFHSNFQDEALLPAAAIPAKLRGTRFGSMDGARGIEVSARLLAGFFAATLDGPAAEPVEAVVAECGTCDVKLAGSDATR
jgi:dienelactone hydrolase